MPTVVLLVIMSFPDNIANMPYPMPKATAAQSVPGALISAVNKSSDAASSNSGIYDEHENQLLNVNTARHSKHAKNGSASSAPGPGLLTNGVTDSDFHKHWWW